ncbi:hypothetical protein L7F22_006529 [Adiantum nelumboides]|nr:hypothetical protein [Adiantum nelumboides]
MDSDHICGIVGGTKVPTGDSFDCDKKVACNQSDDYGICVVDDSDCDWGFDDPQVEMDEEMQPFVDATLGRIWVMREQQSHEVVMNSSEAIHMYGREGGSDVCVGFDYGLANIENERNLWDMFTMEVLFLCGCFVLWPFDLRGC